MGYLSERQLRRMGFASLGEGVQISDKASLYDCHLISIGDRSRIDDFCVVSGEIVIGRNVHITVFCNLAGGRTGIRIGDFSTLAYGTYVFAQTDDYSGEAMTNSTIPEKFKSETCREVRIGRHVILGARTTVLPGVEIGDGVSAGAGTTFLESAEPWQIYVGQPARILRARSKNLLEKEREYLESRAD